MCSKRLLDAARVVCRSAFESLETRRLLSATYVVATNGNDANPGTAAQPWQHIQYAFNHATPGSTVDVMAGTYREKLSLNVSGSVAAGFTTFQAVGTVVINGRGIAGKDLIDINDENYVRITGFTLMNDLNVDKGAAIRITTAGDHIEIDNNTIQNITGQVATAISVYGEDPVAGVSNLLISGNRISNCDASPGEAVSINGNVNDFTITGNVLSHIKGVGIDAIGGTGFSSNPATDYPRNGEISDNIVTAIRPRPGGPPVAGITIDGVQNVTIERNRCINDDLGIEVTCVQPNAIAQNDIVRDNLLQNNLSAGLAIGATDVTQGRVVNCQITNNTLIRNAIHDSDGGDVEMQWGSNNLVANNLIDGLGGQTLVLSAGGAANNTFNYNLYYEPGKPARYRFAFNSKPVIGLSTWQTKTLGQDANSITAAPIFHGATGQFASNSPGVNAGNPAYATAGETDLLGNPRLINGAIDIGADEVG